jgi:ElaB/YqjD/DUF883 family membrane-anchored ribosome-binding protein
MLKQSSTDRAIHTAETMVASTQRLANGALDDMSHAIDHGVDSARHATLQVRDTARRVGQDTTNAIRHDPVKSVLIAAATGAALMALVGLLTRSISRH